MEKILNAEKYLSGDVLRLETFNGVFFGVIGFGVLLTVLFWLVFKNKSEKTKATFITVLCAFNILVFFVYKFFLWKDTSYAAATGGNGFNWFSELPLHLCNINMFLIPIGALTKKRGILGFSFFMATFGALMAILFPCDGFSGYTLLLPRMIGFYLTHILIFVSAASLATLNIYRPKFNDLPSMGITLAILGIGATGVNILIRELGLCSFVNYFYTMGPDGISILEFFWKFVKIPFVYLIPAVPILVVYVSVICGGFLIGEKTKNSKNKQNNENTETEEEKETVTV